MTDDLASLRRKGLTLLVSGGWLVTLSLFVMSVLGAEFAWEAALVSAALNVIQTFNVALGRSDLSARLTVGIMAALQPALLDYEMQRSPWQIDFHLYFFVAMAALAVLCDTRPILLAGAVIILHHALLAGFAPQWVYYGGGEFGRTLVHGSAVIAIGWILSWIGAGRDRLIANVKAAHAHADAQNRKLEEQARSLEQAIQQNLEERKEHDSAIAELRIIREAEHEKLAAQFERSINTVTHTLSGTAQLLKTNAKALNEKSKATGEESRTLAQSAQTAKSKAHNLAGGIAQLSESISSIATNVNQQTELTAHAADRSCSGGETLSLLTAQSDTIGKNTGAIVRIANRTNLLALNAAIEAANAGQSGVGFSVVAREIKGLAEQAGNAASQIDVFLKGVRSGSLDAERSFAAIDEAIIEVDDATRAIRRDVEVQRQSTDTITTYAQSAASEVQAIAEQAVALSDHAHAQLQCSDQIDEAAATLVEHLQHLKDASDIFIANLKVA